MSAEPYKCSVWAGASAVIMARCHGFISGDKEYITQASVSSITLAVRVVSTNETVHTATLDKTEVVFDAMQTGDAWTIDATGYNFSHTIAGSVLSDKGKTYEATVEYTLTDGFVGKVKWILKAE